MQHIMLTFAVRMLTSEQFESLEKKTLERMKKEGYEL